jgi:tetratricopeptide (TPR) repeat protein
MAPSSNSLLIGKSALLLRLALAGGALALASGGGPAQAAVEKAMLRSQEGGSALLRGKYDQAIAAYDQALQETDLPAPRQADLYNDRGVAKWRLARRKEALADFNKAIELAPEYAMLYNNRGNVLLDMGRAEEAVAEFTRAISLAPAYGAAYNNRANASDELGRHEAAITDYRRAIELMPLNAVPFNGRGKAQGALDHSYAALRYLNRAIALNPRYPAALRNRAQIYIRLERYRDALADLERVMDQTGRSAEDAGLYLLRGRAYAGERKARLAYKDFSRAIDLDANNASAYVERALLHIDQTDYEPALTNLNQALSIDGRLTRALYNRALCYFKIGDIDRAAADVSKVIEFDPHYAAAYKLRGDVFAHKARKRAQARLEAAREQRRSAAPESAPPPDDPSKQPRRQDETKKQPQEQAQEQTKEQTQQSQTPPEAAAQSDPASQPEKARALADYRKALEIDPHLSGAKEAIRDLTGAVPDTPQPTLPPAGDLAKGWQIEALTGGRYAATNSRYGKLQVPLEMYGPGTPELLEWTPLSRPLRGVGLLRYSAGAASRPDGSPAGRYEYVAIVDYYRNKVISIEPFVVGESKAKWDWTHNRVVVTDPEGVVSALELRKGHQGSLAAREYDEGDPLGLGRLFGGDDRRPRHSSHRRRRQHSSPGLFDWLFQ